MRFIYWKNTSSLLLIGILYQEGFGMEDREYYLILVIIWQEYFEYNINNLINAFS